MICPVHTGQPLESPSSVWGSFSKANPWSAGGVDLCDLTRAPPLTSLWLPSRQGFLCEDSWQAQSVAGKHPRRHSQEPRLAWFLGNLRGQPIPLKSPQLQLSGSLFHGAQLLAPQPSLGVPGKRQIVWVSLRPLEENQFKTYHVPPTYCKAQQ